MLYLQTVIICLCTAYAAKNKQNSQASIQVLAKTEECLFSCRVRPI